MVGLNFGQKEVMLLLAVFIILGLTVIFHWSAVECVTAIFAVVLSWYGGGMKKEKRLEERTANQKSK